MWAWNITGFIIPGLLLAVFGWSFARRVAPGRTFLAALLCLPGIGFAMAGVFPGDMSNYRSVTTIGHLAGSLVSLPAWFLAVSMLAWMTRKTWRLLSITSVATMIVMVATFSLYAAPDITRAIVQRLTFAVLFAWYVAAALLLLTRRASR